MTRRLMLAHLHNSVDGLDEVETLLSDLREAWNAIGDTAAASAAAAPAPQPAVPVAMADPLAPRVNSFVSA
jgi:flagellar protein FliS